MPGNENFKQAKHRGVRSAETSGGLQCSRGATLLEAMLVLPFIIALLFAVIDFSRYLALKAMLIHTAQRAVSLAAVLPGLDAEDRASEEFTSAVAGVEDAALQMATGFISEHNSYSMQCLEESPITLTVPAPSGGGTAKQALIEQPLQVQIRASMIPAFPFLRSAYPSFPIVIDAFAYREPRLAPTLPVQVDCNGYPIGSEEYMTKPCPCTNVTCPPGQEPQWWCNCACKPGFVDDGGGNCVCSDPQRELVNDECLCKNRDSCPPESTFDPETCTCTCPNNMALNQAGNDCECTRADYTEIVGYDYCACANHQEPCDSGLTRDYWDCDCKCISGNHMENGQCVPCETPCPPRSTQQPDCSCQCSDGLQMFKGQCLDPSTCPFIDPMPCSTIDEESGNCSHCDE